jgi:PTS system nitrogen regulatory IIA component
MNFGATLRLLRVDAGVTLRSLAERVGVSSAYLSRVENGHDPVPTPDRLADLAAALGVAPSLMFELAHRVEPFVARYLDEQPAAGALFLDIARRRLGPAQLAVIRGFFERTFGGAPSGSAGVSICGMLDATRVITGVVCDDFGDALGIASSRLTRRGEGLAPRELARRLGVREQLASTAIGGGVAVPHAAGLIGPDRGVLLSFARPLAVPAPDGRPVDLALVLAVEGDRAVEVVSAAVRLLAAAAPTLRQTAPDPARMFATLRETEATFG